ncbi:MAG TPA: sterol desaturase family protein [Myxococcota bacterium]|nr:sterol desaturase family protein [Myxococcota bacterium]
MIDTLLVWLHNPFAHVAILTVAGFLGNLALSTLSYLVWFVWWRDRFNPGFIPDWGKQRGAILWGAIGTLGNAVLMTPFDLAVMNGSSNMYWDVAEHGWGWLAVSALLILVISETAVYWIHRVLHERRMFKYIHSRHHAWREPTPFVGTAFHPVDSFAQAFPTHLCAFLFPVHGLLYVACIVSLMVWTVAIHDRVSLVRWWWLNYTGHHTIHHFYNNYNFGQYTTFWDRWMGTYREPVGERFLRP